MKCKVPTKTRLRRLVNFYEIHSSKELMDFIFSYTVLRISIYVDTYVGILLKKHIKFAKIDLGVHPKTFHVCCKK